MRMTVCWEQLQGSAKKREGTGVRPACTVNWFGKSDVDESHRYSALRWIGTPNCKRHRGQKEEASRINIEQCPSSFPNAPVGPTNPTGRDIPEPTKRLPHEPKTVCLHSNQWHYWSTRNPSWPTQVSGPCPWETIRTKNLGTTWKRRILHWPRSGIVPLLLSLHPRNTSHPIRRHSLMVSTWISNASPIHQWHFISSNPRHTPSFAEHRHRLSPYSLHPPRVNCYQGPGKHLA